MRILIGKLGATGDVVRTTALLRCLPGSVTWITAAKNAPLLNDINPAVRCLSWEERQQALDTSYDLAINLEDTVDVAEFVQSARPAQIFGAYLAADGTLRYTDSAKRWFDLSLISRHGKAGADQLKLRNRSTYQALIFEGLGYTFAGERYVMPAPPDTGLHGDVAVASESGPVWPMKKWAYYEELKAELERAGLTVNVLPKRATLLEHLGDVAGHRCLVGGDSLPMHLALGAGVRCVSIFTCTSPWEIHDYGIQTKVISPYLEEYFYARDFHERATTAVPLDTVLAAVMEQVRAAKQP